MFSQQTGAYLALIRNNPNIQSLTLASNEAKYSIQPQAQQNLYALPLRPQSSSV